MNASKPEAAAQAHQVILRRGSIYLSRETCDAWLGDSRAVALLLRDEKVLILPLVADSPGGLLLKIRNSRGDRVIDAQEFFREKGLLEDFAGYTLPLAWDPAMSALVISDAPRAGA